MALAKTQRPIHARTFAFALSCCVALSAAADVSGQVEPRTGAGTFLVGGGLVFQSAVPEFSTYICPGLEIGGELNGGVLLLPWLGAAGFGRVHNNVETERCVNGLVPPPPDSGTFVWNDISGLRGYPYVSTGLRVTAFSGAPATGAFRGFAGGEWIWGKNVFAPLFGLGMSVPVSGVLLVIEAERRLITVAWDRVETEFRQGQPVSQQRREQTTDRHRWALRLGVERVLVRR